MSRRRVSAWRRSSACGALQPAAPIIIIFVVSSVSLFGVRLHKKGSIIIIIIILDMIIIIVSITFIIIIVIIRGSSHYAT